MAERINNGELFKCRICLSDFTKPRLLDCFHVFCTPCLEKLAGQETKVKCPLCRSDVFLPVDGISGLELFKRNKEQENDQGSDGTISPPQCELCDSENNSYAKCLDCKQHLCLQCHKYHEKFKAMAGHKFEIMASDPEKGQNSIKLQECADHKKELALFCKPCTKAICRECQNNGHPIHDVLPLSYAACMEHDTLYSEMKRLESRVVPAIDNTLMQLDMHESKFYKQYNQISQEMKTRASWLKEILCKTVDILVNGNMNHLEKLKSNQIKQIDMYKDQLETDKISFVSFFRTVEDILEHSSESDIVEKANNRRRQIEKLRKYKAPIIEFQELGYRSEEISMQVIGRYIGNVSLRSDPDTRIMKKLQFVDWFEISESIIDMLDAGDDGSMWLLNQKSCFRYDTEGFYYRGITIDSKQTPTALLRRQDGTLYLWTKVGAKEIDLETMSLKQDLCFEPPFENGTVGSFSSNDTLLIFVVEELTIYGIDQLGNITRKIYSDELSDILTKVPTKIIETKEQNLIILQPKKLITLRPNGRVLNVHQENDSCHLFKSLCIDKCGNILIGFTHNYSYSGILLFSSDGTYLEQIHTFSSDKFGEPLHMTVDGRGNMWVGDDRKRLNFFSYM